jgi:hypothetical protein
MVSTFLNKFGFFTKFYHQKSFRNFDLVELLEIKEEGD